nr:cytochrome c3 family protein [uncultured Fluviicola sp.]
MRHFQQSGFLLIFLLMTMGLATNRCTGSEIPPVDESYAPEQPVEFPHDIHVQKGIDCKYCHNTAVDGKKEGVPASNVCMKCHKPVSRNSSDKNGNK